VLEAASALRAARRLVILGNQADAVRQRVPADRFDVVIQREQLGTGHAVMQARPALGRAGGDVLILNGDLPGLRAATLGRFVAGHRRSGAAASLLTATIPEPAGYGRVLRDGKGGFARIVEHTDATSAERAVREINAGIYCFSVPLLFKALAKIRPVNRQGEYYLPDVLELLLRKGGRIRAVSHADAWEVLGVNSRAELAEAGRRINARRVAKLMEGGVTVIDPAAVRVGPDVRAGRDTVIHPGVTLEGSTVIGRDVMLSAGCTVRDCRIGDGVTVLPYSVLTESRIGPGTRIGPFAHIRPGTELADGVHIGNFVEVKKSSLASGSKANHLTYIGDSAIGSKVNVGAGTITCNYDGVNKNRTVIEDGVFIGSDTALVAPVKVGKGAYVGAGSTITQDVPAGALAIARGRQKNIEGWVARKKGKH